MENIIKIIDEIKEPELEFNELLPSDCWEARVDEDKIIMLISGEEKGALEKPENITKEYLINLIALLKDGRLNF